MWQLPLRQLIPRNSSFSDVYMIGDESVPLFKSFVISIKPTKKGNPQHLVVAKQGTGGRWEFLGNDKKEDGSIYASSSTFGNFCVMADSTSPVIKALNVTDGGKISGNQSSIRIQLTDDFSGINSQKIICTIDGAWELFEFDGKSSTISHKIGKREAGKPHILEVMAYDNANNMARSVFHFSY